MVCHLTNSSLFYVCIHLITVVCCIRYIGIYIIYLGQFLTLKLWNVFGRLPTHTHTHTHTQKRFITVFCGIVKWLVEFYHHRRQIWLFLPYIYIYIYIYVNLGRKSKFHFKVQHIDLFSCNIESFIWWFVSLCKSSHSQRRLRHSH